MLGAERDPGDDGARDGRLPVLVVVADHQLHGLDDGRGRVGGVVAVAGHVGHLDAGRHLQRGRRPGGGPLQRQARRLAVQVQHVVGRRERGRVAVLVRVLHRGHRLHRSAGQLDDGRVRGPGVERQLPRLRDEALVAEVLGVLAGRGDETVDEHVLVVVIHAQVQLRLGGGQRLVGRRGDQGQGHQILYSATVRSVAGADPA